MARQLDSDAYFDDLSRRNWGGGLFSLLIACGLNLGLFLFMPYLMDPSPKQASIGALVPQINVIRIKRPESEVKRKPVKPPEPEKIKPKKRRLVSKPKPFKVRNRLTLPFEINPKLPSGPRTLDLPPLESAPLTDLTGLPEVFAASGLDAPLMVLSRIEPIYPMRAKQRGIEGWVKIKFIINETGAVNRITILDARPPNLFERAVERAVSKWRFKPGTVGGLPVKSWAETTIRFELE